MPRRILFLIACLGGAALASTACGDAGPGFGSEPIASSAFAVQALTAVSSFGSNPGNLLMYTYAPAGVASNAPLVLALHGCTQSASVFENAGWNSIADAYKFYVVYPQQQSANNIEGCFNWFGNTSGSLADITRGEGEAESVTQMVDYMKSTYSIDPKRVFVSGFSAGAAYTVALLAMYPDVFAAGASFSGLPFGCANSETTAFTCMDAPTSKTAAEWGTLARAGFPSYAGPYPRLSVWQGSEDTTVSTANLAAIVSQWTDVTGASASPTTSNTVGGFPHAEYASANGTVEVESYSITGMSHAVAIDVSSSCGTADTYDVDEKVCAVDYAAKFFGLEGAQGTSSGGSGGGGSGSGSGSGAGAGSGSGSGGGAVGAGDDAGTSDRDGGGSAASGCSMTTPSPSGGGWVLAGVALGLCARRKRAR